jgi:hypothetical protein
LDLPEISHFHKVFIKMDVEGFEHKVLLGAEKFFQKLDVRGIIMEWNWHVGRTSSVIIIDLPLNAGDLRFKSLTLSASTKMAPKSPFPLS